MQEKIECLFLYGGIGKEDYLKVRPMIDESNRKTVLALSGFATVLILFMLISSMSVSGVGMNKIVYAAGAIISPLMFLAALFFIKKNQKLTPILVSMA